MKREIGLKLIFCAVIGLAIFTVGAADSAVYGQDCKNITDQEMVDAIYSAMQQDAGIWAQRQHINVVSVNLAVKLFGWTDSSKDYKKMEDIIYGLKCLPNLLNRNNFSETPPDSSSTLRSANGCTRGTKPCGEICIPESESCTIKQ